MEKRTMTMQASSEQRRAMPQVNRTMAAAERERSSSSTALELGQMAMSPLFYADLMGLMTYLSIVGGPGPWFELPSWGGAPAENRHGEPPPPRSAQEQSSAPAVVTKERGGRGRDRADLAASRHSWSALHPTSSH
jgi:hypothetical protein